MPYVFRRVSKKGCARQKCLEGGGGFAPINLAPAKVRRADRIGRDGVGLSTITTNSTGTYPNRQSSRRASHQCDRQWRLV
jgi:hypothetical protein